MLRRFSTREDSHPLSSINASVIGEKVIIRNRKIDDHHAARLVEVFSYVIKDESPKSDHKNYFFNGDESHPLRETDVFIPLPYDKYAGFDPYQDTMAETMTVKEAGIDLVGNKVAFPRYLHKTGIKMKGEITGLVIGVYQSDDIYVIELDSPQPENDALVIKVHANYQITTPARGLACSSCP